MRTKKHQTDNNISSAQVAQRKPTHTATHAKKYRHRERQSLPMLRQKYGFFVVAGGIFCRGEGRGSRSGEKGS